jgi:hypothetical protein
MASKPDPVALKDARGSWPSDILTGSREQFQKCGAALPKREFPDGSPGGRSHMCGYCVKRPSAATLCFGNFLEPRFWIVFGLPTIRELRAFQPCAMFVDFQFKSIGLGRRPE